MMMAALLRLFHRVSVFVNTRCVIVLMTPAHRTAGVAAATGTDADADAAAAAAATAAAAAAAVPFGSGRRR